MIPRAAQGALPVSATRANGQPAVGTYLLNTEGERYLPIALDVLTLAGAQIAGVVAFRTPEVFPDFDLPVEVRP